MIRYLSFPRYIAVESGSQPSLTSSRSHALLHVLKPALCPISKPGQELPYPIHKLSRLVEASSLVDRIHVNLNSPTPEMAFNMEELILTVQASTNFKTILYDELGEEDPVYSGGLHLCHT